MHNLEDFDYLIDHLNGDIDIAELFASIYQTKLRFVPESKSYYFYDGKVWRLDVENMQAKELAKEFVKNLIDYALEKNMKDEDIKYFTSFFSSKKRLSLIYDAQSCFPVSLTEFDKSLTLLNCQNGTLQLGSNNFYEHSSDDLLTKICNVEYNPDKHSALWEKFIDDIMQGNNELKDFLQMVAGLCLTGFADYECFFILYGESTRNGKGTFCETLLYLLGDYGKTASAETIACKSFSNGSAPTEDIARLKGARFVNISEPAKGLYLNSALVKSLTGNDTICARYLHQNSFEFKPQFKMLINTNHLPKVEDDSIFSSNRVKLIPFNKHFEEHEQDISLKAKLREPDNLSGILNWCIDGLNKLLQAGKLEQPKIMQDAVSEYRKASDTIKNFIDEMLISSPNERTKTSIIYKTYVDWCRNNGFNTMNNRDFLTELKRHLEVKRHNSLGNIVIGYVVNHWN